MKILIVILATLASFTSLAEVKCFKEFRALETAMKNHVVATDKVAVDSLESANFVMSMAIELIAQPNARVGGYGYSVKQNAQTMINNVNSLQANAKAKENLVEEHKQALEDCLINF